MKHYNVYLVLAVLMSMVGTKAFAYDVEVENEDGVTIYYNYINDNTELEVASNTYKGDVVIPESVTILNRTRKVTSIGEYAFYECSGLNSVTIPASVTSIGNNAFSGCSGLSSVTIPSSVTSIGNNAFSGCSGLKKVIVKDLAAWCSISFDGIGANPLYYAHHLYADENTEITDLVIPDSVTSIGNDAFSGYSGLSSVTIPSSVTSIGDWAFYGCSSLSSITIPSSVTSIGNDAFYCCYGLKKVIVKDLAAWCGISFGGIGANPLYYAHHLYADENTEITDFAIPEGVMSIGKFAFYESSGLSSVTIPSSVTSIGGYAFYECSGLSSVIIPNSVTSIGGCAFLSCI